MRPQNWEDIWEDICEKYEHFHFVDETDYAGVEHLKLRLDEIGYTDENENDLVSWQVEALDPEWKTKHLDHLRDEFGEPDNIEGIYCEGGDWGDDWENMKVHCEKKAQEYLSQNPGAEDPPLSMQKQWANEFCHANGLGRAIPYFLFQYLHDVKWIESHLIQTIETKKPDGRGKNPNSLKNLKQYREVRE